MTWTIDKSFNFEAGHRVWAQKLDRPELSLTTDCACKHLHGHSYKLKVFLESAELNGSGMVTDFKNLNWVKEFLDTKLDHKFIIDIHDPLFRQITGVPLLLHDVLIKSNIINFTNLKTWLVAIGKSSLVINEFTESFVLVNFIPTSENLCTYLAYEIQSKLIIQGVRVSAVELWETEKSHCRYETSSPNR